MIDDTTKLLLTVGLIAVIVGITALIAAMARARAKNNDAITTLGRMTEDLARHMSQAQAELGGRLQQLAENQTASQAQLTRTLDQRLEAVTHRLGEGLHQHTEKTGEAMGKVHERLAVIDKAQENLTQLSKQVVGLQDVLSNKQARGAFGEIQLEDLVRDMLPPSAYGFQVTLGNAKRADCVLKLPNPPGSIVIDAKFPLESYRALRAAREEPARTQALRAFAADVMNHIRAIADKYIVPGETAESAMMFLPSEAVYAELHASLPDIVAKSFSKRVWIVSPTTLMATLNTVRAVLKDANMREQAGVIQGEVVKLLGDIKRLDERVGKLQRHFGQATEDIREIRISTDKVTRRSENIEAIELGEDGAPPALAPLGVREVSSSD
ncbi:DNA recombination protein RmuC [Varunaivibrio sulfuroxidans]|uniref:DNA recombination protein RmuC homolog n=1 Tax=Varunaivibrio sulfuroxidans TaxID=1773489 RepID=A0A4R3JI24_9PROT|nr:DNA recombination protein RmuC [Varunaivibrio sulfuroxidans]TCS65023.1 DNA recombination protein RmuC [Varunaivibrio sulfuroxidans]WES29687.1 DNA recombination protein RmuC [Varunaivibrio sulfuroxidans]